MDKQSHLDQLFLLAKQDQAAQSFEQTSDRFISSMESISVNKTKTKRVFTKKWIIMLTTVSAISLSLFLFWNNKEVSKSDLKINTADKTQPISVNKHEKFEQIQEESKRNEKTIQRPDPFFNSIQNPMLQLPFISENNQFENQIIVPPYQQVIPPNLLDEPVPFPKLTEEEIAITKKKKKAMLKAFVKHDKDEYIFVPSGTFDYNGKQVSVQAFYMGVGEITNFEYRTFLFDLLIQGRNEEFLKAKPNQEAWFKERIHPKVAEQNKNNYFSYTEYNNYPAVNVSREGAEMYCLWLSEEVRKYIGNEKEPLLNDIRLPLRVEWVKAASNEGKQLPYTWDGPYVRNSKGLILANHIWEKYDPAVDSINKKNKNTKQIMIIAPSISFWPSKLGFYNLCGNVAEMVYEEVNEVGPGTAGGSWRNNSEEIKIYATDQNKGVIDPKPTIGFRVVSTSLVVPKK
ncbi:formylglycine-generating enzyme family protein [Fluviicola taffensis]|uniref:Sulfatase-modifying factor enzyme-like domain-containing protein n=1 Tax=Fluviicola taffensis (strain DSM 16823 / NCIMB 13979 / RW262) TaxID=755732 RepID=F2IDE1_FLUTR|nr:SUMF1/EgtB/PvdO family nonheme iron enzyme [Fluviicola taffensis]AEA42317.1 hypothetical protein Fluta_0308 [Fluviicola taffensis DSM 16823]